MKRSQKAPLQTSGVSGVVKDISRKVVAGLLVTAILAAITCGWLTREDQLRLQLLQREMDSVSFRIDRGSELVTALQLFVVSAHPDRACLPIVSAKRLGELTAKELHILGVQMDKYPDPRAFSLGVMNDDLGVSRILTQHQIDQNDLENYWHSVRTLGKDR